VRQGCNVSPLLFDIEIEQDIDGRKEYCTEMKVNGVRILTLNLQMISAIVAQDETNLKRAL
jgi:hypothetical protein